MPRCASNSARCGPTPLIMRTSVLRLIAILGCAFAAAESIHFISFPLRTFLDAAVRRSIATHSRVSPIRLQCTHAYSPRHFQLPITEEARRPDAKAQCDYRCE